MRRPSTVIVVDTAILIAAARGRSSAALLHVAASLALVTTDRAVVEARRRIVLGMREPQFLPVLDALLAEFVVAPVGDLEPRLAGAEMALRDAVPSRNGSVRDAHILALAWDLDADIWTTDRDFGGTGIAVWSTPNLLRALAEG